LAKQHVALMTLKCWFSTGILVVIEILVGENILSEKREH